MAHEQRLEELRAAIHAENISWGELAELQSLADHIQPGDVELAEWAGIPENEFHKRGAIRCPTATHAPDGTPHTIVGCGSANVVEDESEPGLYDCLDCGIWFQPSLEA